MYTSNIRTYSKNLIIATGTTHLTGIRSFEREDDCDTARSVIFIVVDIKIYCTISAPESLFELGRKVVRS